VIRKFLNDTLDLLLLVGEKLGISRGGRNWQRERIQRRWDQMKADRENEQRAIRATHRMCRECGAFVANSEAKCTKCGASMRGIPKGGLGRFAQSLLPSFGSASMTVVGALVTIFVACAVASGGQGFLSLPLEMLVRLGAKIRFGGGLLGDEYYAFTWWRLVNPVFLHGGVMHIAFNGYALANLGPLIEAWVGARRFLVIFTFTGAASFAVSALFSPAPSVGASGALFGLIGFGIVFAYAGGGGSTAVAQQLVRWALLEVLLFFLGPILGRIDHWAHFGGFVAGGLMGLIVRGRSRPGSLADRAWTLGALLAVLLPLAGFVMAILDAAGRGS
jgi:membrane associated rhomboid family serine protease